MEESLAMPLLHVNWNITYECNFNCEHCYSRSLTGIVESTLSQKLAIARNIVRAKVFTVNLGGGEPLLSPDTLPVVEYLASRGVGVSLCTNGWQADEASARRLRETGLSEVFLSLDDALPEVHDAFRRKPGSHAEVLRSARLYKAAGLCTRLSVTMTRFNFDRLEDLVGIACDVGCDLIELKRLKLQGNAVGRRDLELDKVQESLLYERVPVWKRSYPIEIALVYAYDRVDGVDEGCPCGRSVLAVRANGDIAPCVYNPHPIGNALVDDIGTLWRESPLLIRMRNGGSCLGLEPALDEAL